MTASPHNFKVIRMDGTTYDMASMDVMVAGFTVSSPEPRHHTEEIDARDGVIDVGTTYAPRRINAHCYMNARDLGDYPLLRNQIFQVFDSHDAFYLICDSEPDRRWLAKYDGSFSMQPTLFLGEFTLSFISCSPYAESVATTLDAVSLDTGLWQMGQGLIADDVSYTFTTPSFSVYNGSDRTIDPRRVPLVITYQGEATYLSIQNTTTGDIWSYAGSTSSTDLIQLDGVRSLQNGISIFGNTIRTLITLAKGWNNFVILGSTGNFTISFNFRFYNL